MGILDIFDSYEDELEPSNFDDFFSIYGDYTQKLVKNEELLREINNFVAIYGEFDVYDDAKLNEYLFALAQNIEGILLVRTQNGNEAEPEDFFEIFKDFLMQANNL